MCPISGVVQFFIVLISLLLVCHAVVVKVNFDPNKITVLMYDTRMVNYSVVNDEGTCLIYCENPKVAAPDKDIIISQRKSGSFNITGNFLGKTLIKCKNTTTNANFGGSLEVIVVRKKRLIDILFSASVATLVSILYINFGCAIDWGELHNILRKPVGPAIGYFGQFLIMPLSSYVLGLLIFPASPDLRLGLFFTGVSPAGGASNVWTVVLGGNMNLSVIMTAICTVAAFAMMPLWIFSLGRSIFESAELRVPYKEILTYVVALIVPLLIGYLIQRYLKKVADFMSRILKTLSCFLILFIIIFAVFTNLYLFQLFSWQIIVAGMGLPMIGYILGYLVSWALRQSHPDSLAIAIEVGIQNTGIAIFLLRFALPQPEADLTTIVPVSVATLTPLPLILFFLFNKLKQKVQRSHSKLRCYEEPSKVNDNENGHISDFRGATTFDEH